MSDGCDIGTLDFSQQGVWGLNVPSSFGNGASSHWLGGNKPPETKRVTRKAPKDRSASPDTLDAALPQWNQAADVAQRLFDLMVDAVQEEEQLPAAASVRGLRSFMSTSQGALLGMPAIGLNDRGHLSATWRRGDKNLFSLRFLGEENIEFAWTLQSDRGRATREWGESTWRELLVGSPHVIALFVDS